MAGYHQLEGKKHTPSDMLGVRYFTTMPLPKSLFAIRVLSSVTTVNAKHSVKREALEVGVTIKTYHTDNGILKSKKFSKALLEDFQYSNFSDTGAKHQNGVAERAIGTVQSIAPALLLHVHLHWPEAFNPNL